LGGIPARQLPNLLGLLGGWQSGGRTPGTLQVIVLALSAALLIAVASLKKTARDPHFFKLCFACAVISALLVGYSTNSYDLSLLLVPLAVIADHVVRQGSIKGKLVIPVIPLLVSPFWFFLWLGWARIGLMAIFLVWWLYALYRELKQLGASQDSLSPTVA